MTQLDKYICVSFTRKEYDKIVLAAEKKGLNRTAIIRMFIVQELKKFLDKNKNDEIVLTFSKKEIDKLRKDTGAYKSHTVAIPSWCEEAINDVVVITNYNISSFVKYLIMPEIEKICEED